MGRERIHSPGSNRSEKRVSALATEAGLTVYPAASIEAPEPVLNKDGYLRKTKTTPDFHIVDPETGSMAIVEVTKGSGDNEHKAAQRRVIDAAHVENYFVITGNMIDAIEDCPTPEAKRAAFVCLFAWDESQ